MEKKSLRNILAGTAALLALTLPLHTALAHDPYGDRPGWGMGHDMGMMGHGMGMGMMGDGMSDHGMGMMGGLMMGGRGEAPWAMLDLTDEQRKKIRDIKTRFRKQQLDLMNQMIDRSENLHELYAVPEPDPKRVGSAYAELSGIKRQMVEASVQMMNEIRGVLTNEQREQLQNWKKKGWSGGGGMMGPGAKGR